MKKFLAFMLACLMVLSLAACQNGGKETEKPDDTKKVKVGFIFLHDENSTYDKNFMDAAKAACEELCGRYGLEAKGLCLFTERSKQTSPVAGNENGHTRWHGR